MQKKLFVLAVALLMATGGGGVALAGHGGDHEPQDHGLCTAYFNGQKKGHDKKDEYPPPFKDLAERATDGDSSTPVQEDIGNFCGDLTGGNPEHGRYPQCFEDGAWNPDCDS